MEAIAKELTDILERIPVEYLPLNYGRHTVAKPINAPVSIFDGAETLFQAGQPTVDLDRLDRFRVVGGLHFLYASYNEIMDLEQEKKSGETARTAAYINALSYIK